MMKEAEMVKKKLSGQKNHATRICFGSSKPEEAQ
jgi:hypothetical protein